MGTRPQSLDRMRRQAKAFTLIEVLVVVAIVALLVTILLPALKRAREQSRVAVCLASLHQCGSGFAAYSLDNKGLLPMRGGYNYNIKEPDVYHLKNGYKRGIRVGVNYGLLYGKYCGKEGNFYYCPGNLMQSYSNQSNGWPSFFDPDASVTWGGYGYAAPVLPGNAPTEDPVIKGTLTSSNLPAKSDASPGAWKQATQAGSVNEGLPWRSYGQWLVDQVAAGKKMYLGRIQALMTDQLIGSGTSQSGFSHMNGQGQNVLFTDYHAKWVNDPGGQIRVLKKDPGIGSGMTGQQGLYAAWNILSRGN